MHSLFARIDPHDADDFFHRLYHGVALAEDEALHRLRRHCETNVGRMSRFRLLYDLSMRTIKCWNLTRAGVVVHGAARLAPRADEHSLPEIL
jgi:hypothetical protein